MAVGEVELDVGRRVVASPSVAVHQQERPPPVVRRPFS